MKKQLFIFVLTFSCMTNCAQSSKENINKNGSADYRVDTSRIAVLPFDSVSFLFGEEFKKAKPATLTLNDFSEIENLLEKCISDYNSNQEEIFRVLSKELPKLEKRRFVIDLKQYRRQYVAVINSKGEKEIWINCFCGEIREWNKWWKSNVIIVDDGGNCFFNLKVNLKTGKYYDLMVNGNA